MKSLMETSPTHPIAALLRSPECVQAGAWMEGYLRVHGEVAASQPVKTPAGMPDRFSDVPIPSWPFVGAPEESRSIWTGFVEAGLLQPMGRDVFRATESGRRLLPCFPLTHLRNEERLMERFPRLCAAVRGKRVLDAGCGVGTYSFFLKSVGPRSLIALEYGDERIMVARELAGLLGEELVYLRGSVEQLPLADGSIDFIFCRVVIPLVHHERTIAEFARVLSPGGAAMVMLHRPAYYWRMLARVGLSRSHRKSMVSGVFGLLSGAIFDVSGRQPRWRVLGRQFYLSYERHGSFVRLVRRYGLQLDEWEGGAVKPYAWISKPRVTG